MPRGRLRVDERIISFPQFTPIVDCSPVNISVHPGQFVAQMDPPMLTTPGGIMLRSIGDGFSKGGAAEQMRADCATIRRLGPLPDPDDPRFELALSMHQQLSVGDRVLLIPYVNRFKDLAGIKDAHIGGLDGDEWLDTTVAKQIEDGWQLLGNWVCVRLFYRNRAIPKMVVRKRPDGTIVRKPLVRVFEDWGEIIARGKDAECEPGHEVMVAGLRDVRPYDCKFFASPKGPFGDDVIFFRESSWQAAAQHGELEFAHRIVAVKVA